MRSHFTIAVAAILFFVAFGLADIAYANAFVWDAETFYCNVDSATDLHITYHADSKMRLKEHVLGPFTQFEATPTADDSMTWECEWSLDPETPWIKMGDPAHVGVKFWQYARNELQKYNIYWTVIGVQGNDLPGVGFNVVPWAGSVEDKATYTVTNSTQVTLAIDTLRIGHSHYATPLGSMTYPVTLPEGGFFISFPGPITLGPGQSWSQEFIRPKMTTTGYFIADGLIKVDGNTVGNFVHQHQHHLWYPAPSLTNWGLAILLVLLVLSGVYVIYQRRKGVARA